MVNEILFKGTVIKVGTPITYRCGSDCYAGRVSKLLTAKRIEIELINPGEDFVWEREVWSLRKGAYWAKMKTPFYLWNTLSFGKAIQYLDPGF